MINKLSTIACLLLLIAACSSPSSEENKTEAADDGWITLFDGESLDGWHGYGHGNIEGRWKIYDSTLILDSTVKLSGANGNLLTDELYDNFDLQLDWKISEGGNSGIIFNVEEDTTKFEEPFETGPEIQVIDNDRHPDAKIEKHRAGDLYDLVKADPEMANPVGEWNHSEIISNNGTLQVFLNGTNVLTTHMWDAQWDSMVANSKFKTMPGFGKYKKGAICLQDHGDVVSYKNIRLKKL